MQRVVIPASCNATPSSIESEAPETSILPRFCNSKEQIRIGIRLQLCGCSDHSFHSPFRPRSRAPLFPLRTPAKRPTHIIRINPTHHHLPPHTPRIDTRQLAPRLHRPGRMPGLWQIGVVAQRRVATIQCCAGRRRRRHRCRRWRGRHRSGWRRIGRKALWRKQI